MLSIRSSADSRTGGAEHPLKTATRTTVAFSFTNPPCRFRLWRRSLLGADRAMRRKAYRKPAAGARLAVDLERRLVPGHGVLHDREPEAGAAGLARAAAIDAVEALGEAGPV